MTHVDTLIRHGFEVSTNLELASHHIHELETMLTAAAENEDVSESENPHDDADDATLVAQSRRLALAEVHQVRRDLETAVATLDTVDDTVTELPSTAYIDEILQALAEAGVSIGRLAAHVQRCRGKFDRLGRIVNDLRRTPADGALAAQVLEARAKTIQAANYITYLAAEHKLLVERADSADILEERQASLDKADAAHAQVETFDDLLSLSQQLYELLGIVAERAERAENLLSSRRDKDTSHGFTWTASQWGLAARSTAIARGEITAAIDEVSSAIAALEDVHDLDHVSNAVKALADDAISLTGLAEWLEHIRTELSAAWDTVPAKKEGGTHTATVVDAAFDDAETALGAASFALGSYIDAHPEVVAAIDEIATS